MTQRVDTRLLRAVRRMANGSAQGRFESAQPVRLRPRTTTIYHGAINPSSFNDLHLWTYQGEPPESSFVWTPLRSDLNGQVVHIGADVLVGGGTVDIDVTVNFTTFGLGGTPTDSFNFNLDAQDSFDYDPGDFGTILVADGDYVECEFSLGAVPTSPLLLAVRVGVR